MALEFELLRLAAAAAGRPDSYLLVQSLERAWLGIARRVVPLLDAEATGQWALRAFHALGERDAQALKRELLPLLKVGDERVLGRLAPTPAADGTPEAPRAGTESPPVDTSPTTFEGGPGSNLPNRSGCLTTSDKVQPPETPTPESPSTDCGGSPGLSVPGAGGLESRTEVMNRGQVHPPGSSTGGAPGHALGLSREAPHGPQTTGTDYTIAPLAPSTPSTQPLSLSVFSPERAGPHRMLPIPPLHGS